MKAARMVLLLVAALSLIHSAEYAMYSFWASVTKGELVYTSMEVSQPLVMSNLRVAWVALTTPEPGNNSGFVLFRAFLPLGLGMVVVASLRTRKEKRA